MEPILLKTLPLLHSVSPRSENCSALETGQDRSSWLLSGWLSLVDFCLNYALSIALAGCSPVLSLGMSLVEFRDFRAGQGQRYNHKGAVAHNRGSTLMGLFAIPEDRRLSKDRRDHYPEREKVRKLQGKRGIRVGIGV